MCLVCAPLLLYLACNIYSSADFVTFALLSLLSKAVVMIVHMHKYTKATRI